MADNSFPGLKGGSLVLFYLVGAASWAGTLFLYIATLMQVRDDKSNATLKNRIFDFEEPFWLGVIIAHSVVLGLVFFDQFTFKGKNWILQTLIMAIAASITAFVPVALTLALVRAGSYGMIEATVISTLGENWLSSLSNVSTALPPLITTLVKPESAVKTNLDISSDNLVLYPALSVLTGLVGDAALLAVLFKYFHEKNKVIDIGSRVKYAAVAGQKYHSV
jgi:hypothetical protein